MTDVGDTGFVNKGGRLRHATILKVHDDGLYLDLLVRNHILPTTADAGTVHEKVPAEFFHGWESELVKHIMDSYQ